MSDGTESFVGSGDIFTQDQMKLYKQVWLWRYTITVGMSSN